MDEPIYLLCLPATDSMFWYVIEDGRNINQNQIIVDDVSKNNSDILRTLRLPDLSHQVDYTKLVVINSCIYMLGSNYISSKIDKYLHYDIVNFFDLNLHKSWQFGPSLPSPPPLSNDVATSNNGSIVVLSSDYTWKKSVLLLECLTWKVLPNPSKELRVSFRSARLLAVTDTHIYCIVPSKTEEPFSYGLRFSFVNEEWEVFDKRSFTGIWSNGVVLNESYLVLYGSPIFDREGKEKGLLRVYDLKECQWVLMEPYAGNMYEKVFPPCCSEHFLEPTLLFKVAHNKIALVWKRKADCYTVSDRQYEIYCTKFILHKISGTNPPSFYFEVFSHATYCVCGLVIDCAVGLTVGDEGKAKKKQCHGLAKQDEKEEEERKIPI